MEKETVSDERLAANVRGHSSGNDFHPDSEMGLGAVDIERIEKVYRYDSSFLTLSGLQLMGCQEIGSPHHSRYTQF